MSESGNRNALIDIRKRVFANVGQILNGETNSIDLKGYTSLDSKEEIEYLLNKLLQIRNDLSSIEMFFAARIDGGNLNDNRLPELNIKEIINSLDASKKRSLWLQGELKKDIIIPPGANHHEFYFEKTERRVSSVNAGGILDIIAHNGIILQVSGPERLIDYIQTELSSTERWTEHEILHGITLPASTVLLDGEIRSLKARFIDLRDKAKDIIDQIECLLIP